MKLKPLNESQICQDYLQLKSMKAAGLIQETHSRRVKKILLKYNIPIYSNTETQSFCSPRKKSIDSTSFSSIDTEEQAYWLGFMAADGCNFTKKHYVSILLSAQDIEILEKFKKFLKYEGDIKLSNSKSPRSENYYDYAKLSFSDPKISADLCKFGIVNNKTYVLKFPDFLPEHLIKHYIRGHFDGDGCFWQYLKSNKNRKVPTGNVSIISTKNFVDGLITNVRKLTGLKMGIKNHPNNSNQYATIGGSKQVIKFMDWLYQESTIYLKRKFEKYNKFKDLYEEYLPTLPKNKQIIQMDLKNNILAEFSNIETASNNLKIPIASIYSCCKGHNKTAHKKFKFCYK